MDFTNGVGEHQFEFSIGLAGSCIQHSLWRASSLESLVELSSRGNFKTASLSQEVLQNGAIRVRFHGITDMKLRGKSLSQKDPFLIQYMTVIDKQRGPIQGSNSSHWDSI